MTTKQKVVLGFTIAATVFITITSFSIGGTVTGMGLIGGFGDSAWWTMAQIAGIGMFISIALAIALFIIAIVALSTKGAKGLSASRVVGIILFISHLCIMVPATMILFQEGGNMFISPLNYFISLVCDFILLIMIIGVKSKKESTKKDINELQVNQSSTIRKIHFTKGEYMGAVIDVTGTLVLGSDVDGCNLVFNDESVSRKHLTIRFDSVSSQYVIQDFSKNGTFLVNNGNQRLENGKEYYLPIGTYVSMGIKIQEFILE